MSDEPHFRRAVVAAAVLGNVPGFLAGVYRLLGDTLNGVVILGLTTFCFAGLYALWRGGRRSHKAVAAAAAILNALAWGLAAWLSCSANGWHRQMSAIVGLFTIGIAVLLVAVLFLLQRSKNPSCNRMAVTVAIAAIMNTVVLGSWLSVELEAARSRPEAPGSAWTLCLCLWDLFEDHPATGILRVWCLSVAPLLNLAALFALWRGHAARS